MSIYKLIPIIIFLSGLQMSSMAQKGMHGCYGFDCKEKKWSASFFTGYTLSGPAGKIKDRMLRSDFGDSRPGYAAGFKVFDPVKYPVFIEYPSWNFEIRYKASKHSSWGLDAGQLSKNKISGYDHILTISNEVDGGDELGNYLTLRSDLKSVSLLYIRKINLIHDEISVGPVMGMYSISDVNTKKTMSHSMMIKPGIHVGYGIEFLKTKSFFVKAQVKYTWLPDAYIGPFVKEFIPEPVSHDPGKYTSVFEATKVPLSTINFGLSTGWRF